MMGYMYLQSTNLYAIFILDPAIWTDSVQTEWVLLSFYPQKVYSNGIYIYFLGCFDKNITKK